MLSPADDDRRQKKTRKETTMYDTILLTLDGTPTDRAIIEHVKELAKLAHSRIVLLHVADGWAARTYGPDAVSPEITEDTAYLERVRLEFQALGIHTQSELAYGEPDKEIIKWVRQKPCDLVAMSTCLASTNLSGALTHHFCY